MPIDYTRYPRDWIQIRNAVLLRAGGDQVTPAVGACCERCGVRNYSVGYYNFKGLFSSDGIQYDDCKLAKRAAKRLKAETAERYITVVLAVAHIDDPDPMNSSMENLLALCQRCHHLNDLTLKQKHERIRQRNKQITQGQLTIDF